MIVCVVLGFLLLCFLGGYGRAQDRTHLPPIITEIRGRVTVPIQQDHPEQHPDARPEDGPMCLPPQPVVWDGPWPTHAAVLTMEPATPEESREVSLQLNSCARGRAKEADPLLILALLRLERDLGVPSGARGILGATWCWESALRPKPRVGDEGRSHGPFQMMGWFYAWCGLPAVDHVMYNIPVSATCYWSRVQHYLDDGKCPGNVARAEAMAANAMKYKHRGCKAKSRHFEELERWRSK